MRVHGEVIPSERLTGIYTGQPGRVERAGSRGRWVFLFFSFGVLGFEFRQQGKVGFDSFHLGFWDLHPGGRGDM